MMEAARISKTDLAKRMKTSRTEIYNLLDPSDTGVTLATVAKASRALGMNFAIVFKPKRAVRMSKRTSSATGTEKGPGSCSSVQTPKRSDVWEVLNT